MRCRRAPEPITGHKGDVFSALWSPDGRTLASAGKNGSEGAPCRAPRARWRGRSRGARARVTRVLRVGATFRAARRRGRSCTSGTPPCRRRAAGPQYSRHLRERSAQLCDVGASRIPDVFVAAGRFALLCGLVSMLGGWFAHSRRAKGRRQAAQPARREKLPRRFPGGAGCQRAPGPKTVAPSRAAPAKPHRQPDERRVVEQAARCAADGKTEGVQRYPDLAHHRLAGVRPCLAPTDARPTPGQPRRRPTGHRHLRPECRRATHSGGCPGRETHRRQRAGRGRRAV